MGGENGKRIEIDRKKHGKKYSLIYSQVEAAADARRGG
jgi:hypothetical protein